MWSKKRPSAYCQHLHRLSKESKENKESPPAPAAVTVEKQSPGSVRACEKCGELEGILLALETRAASADDLLGRCASGKGNSRVCNHESHARRLTVTIRSLETGMDALQAEFSGVYDDAERRKTLLEEYKDECKGGVEAGALTN